MAPARTAKRTANKTTAERNNHHNHNRQKNNRSTSPTKQPLHQEHPSATPTALVALLDLRVKLPASLREEDLRGCSLEALQRFSPPSQQEILQAYEHRLRSSAGRKKTVLTDQRKNELFQRCLAKMDASSSAAVVEDGNNGSVTDEEEEEEDEAMKNATTAAAKPSQKSSNDSAATSPLPTTSATTAAAVQPTTGINLASYVTVPRPEIAVGAASASTAVKAAFPNATPVTVTLPQTKFQLQDDAAILFHSLADEADETHSQRQQQEALLACDQAALNVLQKGVPIHKPVPFFANVLQKYIHSTANSEQKDKEDKAKIRNDGKTTGNAKQKTMEKQQQRQQTSTTEETTPSRTPTSNSPAPSKRKKEDIPSNSSTKATITKSSIQILKKGDAAVNPRAHSNLKQPPIELNPQRVSSAKAATPTPTEPAASSTAASTTTSTANAELLQKIQRLRTQLDSKTKQSYQILKRNDDLTKLWQAEKYSVKATKQRNQLLEDTIQRLQDQLVHKQELWDQIRQDLTRQVQQTTQQEQDKHVDTIQALTQLSQELCHAQQEKRTLEQTLDGKRARLQAQDEEIQRLQRELKRSELLRPTPRNYTPCSCGGFTDGTGAGSRSRIQALQRELQQTQDKLTKALASNNNATSKKAASSPAGKKNARRERPSLADFVVEQQPQPPGSAVPVVQILQRSGSTDTADESHSGGSGGRFEASAVHHDNDNNARLIRNLLEEPTACQQTQQPALESISTGIRFHGIEENYDTYDTNDDGNDDGSDASDDGRIDVLTEIDFLVASFSESELMVDTDPTRITRILQLDFERNAEVIYVHLVLSVPPEGYPESAPLQVEAFLAPTEDGNGNNRPSVAAQKVAMDAMKGLVDLCRWEANGSLGSNALFGVLQSADQWVQTEWGGIQRKFLPADSTGKACLPSPTSSNYQIGRWLLSSHHLVDPDKIAFVKSTAGHYGLGGYIKLGYPGYLLIEGLEDNCSYFVEALVQQRSKLRKNAKSSRGKTDSSTFSIAGKIAMHVDDLEGARKLPKKQLIEIDKSREGDKTFEEFCRNVQLSKYLL